MREIKFRAYDGTEWVYGTTINYNKHDKQWSIYNDDTESWSYCGEPYQFTGLKDKNSREIFEGDIVQGVNRLYERVILVKVSYLKGCFMFDNYNTHEFFNRHQYIEVIGSIYDNPKLLEGDI